MKGGKTKPLADAQDIIVCVLPFSPDVMDHTLLLPISAALSQVYEQLRHQSHRHCN